MTGEFMKYFTFKTKIKNIRGLKIKDGKNKEKKEWGKCLNSSRTILVMP